MKGYDPCDPVWSISRIVALSVESRFGGNVERAVKETGANPKVLRDVMHQFANLHRRPKLSRLIDQVVHPSMRHQALLVTDVLYAPSVKERIPVTMPMAHGGHRMRQSSFGTK